MGVGPEHFALKNSLFFFSWVPLFKLKAVRKCPLNLRPINFIFQHPLPVSTDFSVLFFGVR